MKFKTTALSILLMTSILSACSAEPSKQIPAEVTQAQSKSYVKRIHFKNRDCEIQVASGYAYSEIDKGGFKAAMLSGPKYDNDRSPSFSVNIVDPDLGGEKQTSVEDIMNGMLKPYRKHLANYKELSFAPTAINGNEFQKTTFSGSYGGRFATNGFVYATSNNGMLFVLLGNDLSSHSAISEPAMLEMVKSFKILPSS